MDGENNGNGNLGATISADEFQALEAKVLQAVEMIRRERDARAAVEAERNAAQAEVAALQERLRSLEEANSTAQTELDTYHRDREVVRGRVEKLLAQMDELL
jgi:chromosome segregation ATPase